MEDITTRDKNNKDEFVLYEGVYYRLKHEDKTAIFSHVECVLDKKEKIITYPNEIKPPDRIKVAGKGYYTVRLPDSCVNLFAKVITDKQHKIYVECCYQSNSTEYKVIVDDEEWGYRWIKNIDLSNIKDTSNVTDMSNMFNGLYGLESIKFGKFDTSNVRSMYATFNDCHILKELDLSNFVTTQVKDMSLMFRNCYSLKELDLSNFVTISLGKVRGKVRDDYLTHPSPKPGLYGTFMGCYSLQSIKFPQFNTSCVKYFDSMFFMCRSLRSLNLSMFNIDNALSIAGMFYGCKSLEILDLSYININKDVLYSIEHSNSDVNDGVTTAISKDYELFGECDSLELIRINRKAYNRLKPTLHRLNIIPSRKVELKVSIPKGVREVKNTKYKPNTKHKNTKYKSNTKQIKNDESSLQNRQISLF